MKQRIKFLFILSFPFWSLSTRAQVLDNGFIDQTIHSNSQTYIGLQIDSENKIWVWEKFGKVWIINNGIRNTNPVLDISMNVIQTGDLGMLGFTIDPNYSTNGFIYVCYVLRPNLIPGAPSGANASGGSATYGKVERYTVTNPNSSNPVVNLASKLVLLGSNNKGIPVTSNAHFGGSLTFGTDGSLIVSTGDGASTGDDYGSDPGTFFNEAMNLGIMTGPENVGSYRSQLNFSLNGKLLRINPISGEGYPNNPFFNNLKPNDPISKFWVKGLRNPWSVVKIPGTGNSTEPGEFLLGDVGSGVYEEINYVPHNNMNFGWPLTEGISHIHYSVPYPSLSSWDSPKILSRDNMYGNINGMQEIVGSEMLPGDNTPGNGAVILGDFYSNPSFPFEYQNNFFYGDYASKHIYRVKFDNDFTPEFVKKFNFTGKFIFGIKSSPVDGNLYYLASNSPYGGNGELHKISYVPGNTAPIASFETSSVFGSQKTTIGFDASSSYDPNGDSLNYSWTFSDGQTATGLAPFVTFLSPNASFYSITATLIVTDSIGLTGTFSKNIGLNNTPPQIGNITSNPIIPLSILTGVTYSGIFHSTYTDEDTTSLVKKWEVFFEHNGHEHLEQTEFGNNANLTLPLVNCMTGVASFWAKVKLTITDIHGFTDTKTIIYSPLCGQSTQIITFNGLSNQTSATNSINLNATSTSGLGINYFVIKGFATLNNSNLKFYNIPGPITVRAAQNGNNTFDQAAYLDQTFMYSKARTAQTINFSTALIQSLGNGAFKLMGTSSLNKPVKYVWISGPGIVHGDTLTLMPGSSPIVIRAFNAGNYLDSSSYIDVAFLPCPANLIITLPHIINNLIDFKSSNSITSNIEINSGINILYDAGKSITLLPGFNANFGSIFSTKIEGCLN